MGIIRSFDTDVLKKTIVLIMRHKNHHKIIHILCCWFILTNCCRSGFQCFEMVLCYLPKTFLCILQQGFLHGRLKKPPANRSTVWQSADQSAQTKGWCVSFKSCYVFLMYRKYIPIMTSNEQFHMLIKQKWLPLHLLRSKGQGNCWLRWDLSP